MNNEYKLKSGQEVLVRDYVTEKWRYNIFQYYDEDAVYKFICIKNAYSFCIPYHGNELLCNKIDITDYDFHDKDYVTIDDNIVILFKEKNKDIIKAYSAYNIKEKKLYNDISFDCLNMTNNIRLSTLPEKTILLSNLLNNKKLFENVISIVENMWKPINQEPIYTIYFDNKKLLFKTIKYFWDENDEGLKNKWNKKLIYQTEDKAHEKVDILNHKLIDIEL